MAVSDYVVAAICGNWYGESQLNPAIWESLVRRNWDSPFQYINGNGTGGYGLGQWTNWNTNHGRLWKLYQWMTSNGYDMKSGAGQVQYFVTEKNWSANYNTGAFPSLARFLSSNSTDINELTKVFMRNWEGINNSSLSTRQKHAQRFYVYIRQNRLTKGYSWQYIDNGYFGGKTKKLSATGYGSDWYPIRSLNNLMMIRSALTGGYVPPSEGSHTITINIEGNGDAFPSSPEAESGTVIDLWADPYGDDSFLGWSVEQGGISIEETSASPSGYRFTMGDEDVIITARFSGTKGDEPDPWIDKRYKGTGKMIYYIPWWAKYGL